MTDRLRVPGRVRSIRQQGKIVFADLHDGREKIQLFIRKNQLPEQALLILDNLDLGDQIGAAGQRARRACLLLLHIHRPFETGMVERDATLARDVGREILRKAIGVIERENNFSGNF